MTDQPVPEMSDEEMRVKIAEACGWIAVKHDFEIARKIHTDPNGCLVGISPQVQTLEHGKDESQKFNYWMVPPFVSDLNACAAFERTMDGVDAVLERREYVKHLMAIVNVDPDMSRWSFIQDFLLLRATSRQRCIAFLKTKGVQP